MTGRSASQATYVALLRGINVGGRNVIRMADLRSAFEEGGFRDVATYIQSGNVIFRATGSTPGALTTRIEEMLASAFDYQARIALRSREAMEAVVTGAPAGFGSQPDRYRYDTLFLRPPLTFAFRPRPSPCREIPCENCNRHRLLWLRRVDSSAHFRYHQKINWERDR